MDVFQLDLELEFVLQERRLLASLAEVGQQVPIVVVKDPDDGRFVVIDGYKRVRSLRRLARDTVGASCWPGDEAMR